MIDSPQAARIDLVNPRITHTGVFSFLTQTTTKNTSDRENQKNFKSGLAGWEIGLRNFFYVLTPVLRNLKF